MKLHQFFRLAAVAALCSLALTGVTTQLAIAQEDATQRHALDGVDDVSITGTGDVFITIGTPAEVTITGPQASLDALDVVVRQDEVEIESRTSDDTQVDGLRYDVTVARLDDLRLRGTLTAEVTGLQGEDFDLEIDGASTAAINDVQLTEFDAELRGASLVTVSGTTSVVDVEARDSSTFNGANLNAREGDVEAFDAAHVIVTVTGLLDAEARSAAVIEYVGQPGSTDFETRDAGTIRQFTGAVATPAASPSAGESGAAEVSLAGRAFTPATIEIATGDQVTWNNNDDSAHTVSASGGAFDSGNLDEGTNFSFTFDEAGEFPYFCAYHPEMQGTIIVGS